MNNSSSNSILNCENNHDFLVKERTLVDDFADETRSSFASVNRLINDICSQSQDVDLFYYNALLTDFDEVTTSTQTNLITATDSLTSDFHTNELQMEEALEQKGEEASEEEQERMKDGQKHAA